MEFITNSPEETEKIGAAIGKIIPAGTLNRSLGISISAARITG